jgi:branched-chain amino acid transport system permease protein
VTQQIILNGLMSGSTYVLMALGFTLIFGIMRIVNFSHGELYMCGAYLVLIFCQTLGVNYFLSLLLAALITAAIGMLIERALLRPLAGKELNGMIMTLAMGIAFQSTALIIFGPDEQTMDRPVTGVWRFHELIVPFDRLFVTGSSAGILLLFYAFLKLTRTGKAMQAVALDAEAASLMGIRPGRIQSLAFAIASGLAALAGGLLAPLYSAGPYVGEVPMLKSFVIVVLGGLGSIPGAIIGGLLIGLIESGFTTLGDSTFAMIASFTLVLVIVLFRPQGLMGTKA